MVILKMDPKFSTGDKVFAKVRGYPPWPARIEGLASGTAKKPMSYRYNIYFYGTGETTVLGEKYIYNYHENKGIWGKRRKVNNFNEGLEEIEEELKRCPPMKLEEETSEESDDRGAPSPADEGAPSRDDEGAPSRGPLDADSDKANFIKGKLKIEAELLQINYLIRSSLDIRKLPDNARCIALLEDLKELKLNALMLKKNPEIVTTIKKLMVYGREPPKSLNEQEQQQFLNETQEIRKKALEICRHFRQIFNISIDTNFFDAFEEEKIRLMRRTKNMNKTQFMLLVKEPRGRCY